MRWETTALWRCPSAEKLDRCVEMSSVSPPRFYNSHTQDPDCKRRVLLCDRLSSLFQEDVEGLNGITSNLPKDNLLGRSWINLSSCSSAIGCLPYFKVNPNGQNASLSFSLQYPSLDVGQIRRWRYWQWRRNLPLHWSKKKRKTEKKFGGDCWRLQKWMSSINYVIFCSSSFYILKSSVSFICCRFFGWVFKIGKSPSRPAGGAKCTFHWI